mmetsp:Transcript_34499/g.33693  ORF Transcript_34499/g.33693 Transcript_34499/m.33693 type:complete len:181 (-) Transcript_34499:39-581(-)
MKCFNLVNQTRKYSYRFLLQDSLEDTLAKQRQIDLALQKQPTLTICRICLASEAPLISPCKCKGSMSFVHEECLVTWLVASGKKECELCKSSLQLYEELTDLKEIIKRTIRYLFEDKKRLVKLMLYCIYVWFLRYKLFSLLKSYFRLIIKVNPMKMVQVLYNMFILILILELGMEEYSRT